VPNGHMHGLSCTCAGFLVFFVCYIGISLTNACFFPVVCAPHWHATGLARARAVSTFFVVQKNTTCVMHVMYMHYHFFEQMSRTSSFVRICPQSDGIRTETTDTCQKTHYVHGFADTFHVFSISVGTNMYIPLYSKSFVVTCRYLSNRSIGLLRVCEHSAPEEFEPYSRTSRNQVSWTRYIFITRHERI
jgi:hypothetical protein